MYAEQPDVCNFCTPTANKEHKCCECRGIIRKGERYSLLQGLWSGKWRTFKTCTDCEAIREKVNDAMRKDGNGEGCPLGYIWRAFYGYPEIIVAMLEVAKRRESPSAERMAKDVEFWEDAKI